MKNVIFFMLPFWGHLNSNIDLLDKLKVNSNLICVTSKKFQDFFRRLEINTMEYPECVEEYYGDGLLNEAEGMAKEYFSSQYKESVLSKIMQANFSTAEEVYWTLMEEVEKFHPDMILADSAAFWAIPFAMKYQKDYICVDSATNMSHLSQDKYFMDYIQKVVSKELGERINASEILTLFKKVERKQKKHYIAFTGCKSGEKYDPDRIIAYLTKELQIGSEEIADTISYAGFNMDVGEIKKENEIFVTRGTISDSYNLSVLSQIAMCLNSYSNFHVTVTLGNAGKLLDGNSWNEQEEHIDVEQKVDQIAELKKSKLMITHGGITGVREAILCETPLIIFPASFHCYQVGLAIEKQHAGILLKNHPLDLNELNASIQKITETPDYFRGVHELKQKMLNAYYQHDAYSFLADYFSGE